MSEIAVIKIKPGGTNKQTVCLTVDLANLEKMLVSKKFWDKATGILRIQEATRASMFMHRFPDWESWVDGTQHTQESAIAHYRRDNERHPTTGEWKQKD